MQQASLKTRSKIQYLANSEVKSTNALPYLGTLIQTRCNLIIGVGATQTTAVSSGARTYPKLRFAVVGAASETRNVSSISADPATLVDQVEELVAVSSQQE
ncbi:hypothetical protein GCM10010468_22980 [Actinocorallia longicatena]|uniref:Uncharacterized protein n=2 Tax=Actinocorallia longicatena TaxID=111803 RepID=A0ABP6Q990_9ACTN